MPVHPIHPGEQTHRLGSVDALRALAVIPVILFHLNPSWLPGGYLGVDVFFVISGYIITGILLKSMEEGTFRFRDFYARRIRRILPALLVMLVTVTAFWILYDPWSFGQLAKLARAVISLRANIAVKDMVGDYWGGDAQTQPLLHTWSLAVEEQFYLAYPLLVWSLWRVCTPRLAQVSLGLLAIGSLAWYWHCSTNAPTSAFYDALSRAWELLAGAMLAGIVFGKADSPERTKAPSVWVGWAGLFIVFFAYASPTVGVAKEWRPMVAALGTTAFLWSAKERRGVHKCLDNPVLVYIGLISYSLYLWHWPVAVFAKSISSEGSHELVTKLLEASVILVLGAASYHLIEKTFRHGERKTWLILGACVVTYFGVRQVARQSDKSLAGELDQAPLRMTDADNAGRPYETIGGFRVMTVGGQRFTEAAPMSPEVKQKYRHLKFVAPELRASGGLLVGGDKTASRRMLVWGDSHAMVMAPMLDAVAEELSLRAEFRIKDGADPLLVAPPPGDDFSEAAYRALISRPDLCVFILRYDHRNFSDYEATFSEILNHSKLIVIQQPPVLDMPDVCTVNYFAYLRDQKSKVLNVFNIREKSRAAEGRKEFERLLFARFSSTAGFSFVRWDDAIKVSDGAINWWDGRDTLFYIDDDHLSEFGVQKAKPMVLKAIRDNIKLDSKDNRSGK